MKLFKRKLSDKQRAALARLADGIECGAKLRPQVHNKLFDWVSNEDFGSCAIGAALECAKIEQEGEFDPNRYVGLGSNDYGDVLAMYGVTTTAQMKTVVIEDKEITDKDAGVDDLIYRLNDWLLWSRERIAQFLREVE